MLSPGDFDCKRCSVANQIENGCEQNSPIPGRWQIITGEKSDSHDEDARKYLQRCPVKLVNNRTWFLIKLFRQFQHGFLPVAGGILDQSAIFLQAVEIIQMQIKLSINKKVTK